MFLKILLASSLIVGFLFGYKVDNISSGNTVKQLENIHYKNGLQNIMIKSGLNDIRNGRTYLMYKKFIFGKKADITLYFTRKSKVVYKTEVTWGMMSGAFNTIAGLNEKEKNKFFLKLKSLLQKKYKPIGENKFRVDNYSTVEILNNATNVQLVYIDKRFLQKNKKEEKEYKLKKEAKEYKKALRDL